MIINVGDADTAQSGGENWANPEILTAVRKFVYNGGGFIGVGEPAAHQWQGKFFQLDDILGVEEERGFNLNTDKYNWEEHRDHFILKDAEGEVDFGEGKKNIYALPETEIFLFFQSFAQIAACVATFFVYCVCTVENTLSKAFLCFPENFFVGAFFNAS